MPSLLVWTAYSLGGLFFIACVVAWYEHLGRSRPHGMEPDWEATAPRALPLMLSVDIEIDALAAPAQTPGDAGDRRAALDGAMDRMARPGGYGSRGNGFGDTLPMVLSGKPAGLDSKPRQRDSAAAD
jgi:hypothetical protein